MISTIKNLLSLKNISGYNIIETITESSELFFIKKQLHMNRSKRVHYYLVTVYKNFQDKSKDYTGSSSCNVYPTMTKDEIDKLLSDTCFSAGLIKNQFYTLLKPSNKTPRVEASNFDFKDLPYWIPKFTDAIFKYDSYENGCINSSELFLNKVYTRTLNSEGIDVQYEKNKGELEFIVNFKGSEEEIELYKDIKFSNFDEDYISQSIKEALELAKEKALAKTTVKSGKYTVLLTGSPVKEILKYYFNMSNTSSVYIKISNWKLNDMVQGKKVQGDRVTMCLNPNMENSTFSVPYDEDGVALNKVSILENGVLKSYHGNNRYSYYLSQVPTGSIANMEFNGGSQNISDFKKEPYVELVSFSDFKLDTLTGDFGGEIRFGWYFDGKKTIPITGGSLSGNINESQKKMYFSKEMQKSNGFVGPKSIKMYNLTIAGI
ncbi:metallopeptidase TldD-related protein [Haloimpatiens sp. FM7315]|uniref:metallopeptidase TldD-related protein n=1 Tax=Haloimpatiens sp. FM7315 TaxID=3298609 RepID=UPI0035A3C56F